jgi:excisionase family DNA binding protein
MDKLLTADEVAELLKVNTEWVWAQARAGRIPHVCLGRYRRFRESALEAWLLDLETGSPTPRAATPPQPVPLRPRAQLKCADAAPRRGAPLAAAADACQLCGWVPQMLIEREGRRDRIWLAARRAKARSR